MLPSLSQAIYTASNPKHAMNTATGILTQRSLNQLMILISTLLVSAIQLKTLIITTNYPEMAASLPQPKRIQSKCPTINPLSYFDILPQFSSSDTYHLFTNNPAN